MTQEGNNMTTTDTREFLADKLRVRIYDSAPAMG
jgi:hypothetical protein